VVAGAAAAALQLLHTLLTAAAEEVDQPDNSSSRASSAASSTAAAAAAARPDFHMPEDLPALLLELWHIHSLQQLAAGCLAQLQQLGLLAAAGHGDQPHLQEMAAAGTQQPGVVMSSVAAAGAAEVGPGRPVGLGAEQQSVQQHGGSASEVDAAYGVQESSCFMAQLKV
jgi:hypothetical protein